jgi:hypothetical protein
MPRSARPPALLTWLLAALGAAAVGGCTGDFTPRSVLENTRVLALEAIPPPDGGPARLDAQPGEQVAFHAFVYDPDDRARFGAWSFCPFTVGAQAGFACAAPSCEEDAAIGAHQQGLEASFEPFALAQACLERLAAAGGALPPGVSTQLPERIDALVRYTTTDTAGKKDREIVQVLPLYPGGAPVPRLAPPAFGPIRIGGVEVAPGGAGPTLGPGQELVVSAEVDASVTVSFFTTAGRFDFDRATGPDANVELKHDQVGAATAATLYLVARDLRGGETVAGPFTVPIGP